MITIFDALSGFPPLCTAAAPNQFKTRGPELIKAVVQFIVSAVWVLDQFGRISVCVTGFHSSFSRVLAESTVFRVVACLRE